MRYLLHLENIDKLFSEMTSQCVSALDDLYGCPICLAPLVLPITLKCGHSFCAPCIQSKRFASIRQACPLCRKQIRDVSSYSINLVLQQLLIMRYGCQKDYIQRVAAGRKQLQKRQKCLWTKTKMWLRDKWVWFVMALLIYQLFKMKLKFFRLKLAHYKDMALEIANSIQVENSLDFKFLLFSQFMRLLFSSIAIP